MSEQQICPFCGMYPYEDVDIGVGVEHVAVNCCEMGHGLLVDGNKELAHIAGLLQSNNERDVEKGIDLAAKYDEALTESCIRKGDNNG